MKSSLIIKNDSIEGGCQNSLELRLANSRVPRVYGRSNFGQSMNQTDIRDFLQGLQSQVNGDALDAVEACCSLFQLTRGTK